MMGHTARAIAHSVFGAMGGLVKAAKHHRRRRTTLQHISRLEPRVLSDIGVEAVHEPRLTRYDVPAHRLSPQERAKAKGPGGGSGRLTRGGPPRWVRALRPALSYSPFQTGRSGSK